MYVSSPPGVGTYIVNGPSLLDVHNKRVPSWFKHFDRDVINEVLHEMQHALPQRVRPSHRPAQVELLGDLLVLPSGAQLTLHVLAEKQVPEQDLVLDEGLSRQDE